MKTKLMLAFCTVLMATSMLSTLAALAAGESLVRVAIGAAGGEVANSTTILRGIGGQVVAGAVANEVTLLCSGFACGVGARAPVATSKQVYLPILMRYR
jgi:hypothetical protein